MSSKDRLVQTASQTVGPFFHIGLVRDNERDILSVLVNDKTVGQHIKINGSVIDGQGKAVPDAMIEIWQANAAGRYNHPEDTQDKELDVNFAGHGRAATNNQGEYSFQTIKPGSIACENQIPQAPHINMIIFARGMLSHAYTRLYFADGADNDHDPVLSGVESSRRQTLIAQLSEINEVPVYRFDIHLQGNQETVFFDV